MRDIRFRGKRKDTGEWVYGYYSSSDEMPKRGEVGHFIRCGLNEEYQVDPDTVGQYTGLRDRKRTAEYPEGQEICDGDILRIKADAPFTFDYIREVKFINGFFGIARQNHIQDYEPINLSTLKICEIIGNKSDNPELMRRPRHETS
jgi:hypothetical protein